MRVWIDLSNSPHVALVAPIVQRLRERGDDVLLTARDHAQTMFLALERWRGEVIIVGGPSPTGIVAKGKVTAQRAGSLSALARAERPDVAFSHGSYAQALASRRRGIPLVTMMDYEYQPANHLSFRLAETVIVPRAFPAELLRRFGAGNGKVRRYDGFKEQLYLAGFRPDDSVLDTIGFGDRQRILVVARPAPSGALYHRDTNAGFERLLDELRRHDNVHIVVLPRTKEDELRYAQLNDVIVPEHPVDARSLMALADLMIGAGGTMTRESALLGTPTYTVFTGRQAAVDNELLRLGRLHRLLEGGEVDLRKRVTRWDDLPAETAEHILTMVVNALDDAGNRAR